MGLISQALHHLKPETHESPALHQAKLSQAVMDLIHQVRILTEV